MNGFGEPFWTWSMVAAGVVFLAIIEAAVFDGRVIRLRVPLLYIIHAVIQAVIVVVSWVFTGFSWGYLVTCLVVPVATLLSALAVVAVINKASPGHREAGGRPVDDAEKVS